jgi:cell division protein ZapD
MQQPTLYEFPLNEKMRNLMRLEHQFAQLEHFTTRTSIWDSQASLMVLLEIVNSIEKNDIKNEITKELERNIGILNNLTDAPAVNSYRLQQTLDELRAHLQAMQNINGKILRPLREEDLLNAIRQRTSVGSSINCCEIPSFYFWINKSGAYRQQQLMKWFEEVQPIATATRMLLNIARDSATFDTRVAENGFFQKSLNAQQACQMVRIEIPPESSYFPETSGSKHRISVRFLTYENTNQRPIQVASDVEFAMSCCGI